jgi:hypothetical protein
MTVIVDAPNCGTASNNHWKVTRLDEPGLIRFHMQTRMATRLDQVAQWLPEGRWAAGRWRPDPPTVPKWLIARVEAALQQGVA